MLGALRKRLMSPQPPARRVARRRLYWCDWEAGDVFAYRMEGDLARERGLYGRHLLFQKADEYVWHPGHVISVVYL